VEQGLAGVASALSGMLVPTLLQGRFEIDAGDE
jgi:hypothetical protein